jgi:hypothetical protein
VNAAAAPEALAGRPDLPFAVGSVRGRRVAFQVSSQARSVRLRELNKVGQKEPERPVKTLAESLFYIS